MDIFKTLVEFVESCYAAGYVFKNGYHRQVVLRDLYMKVFGLTDTVGLLGNSLDLITMTNREGHWQSGPLSRRMRDYHEFKIWDYFKLNWSQWVDQPRYMVEAQLEMAIKEVEKDSAAKNKAINEIDQMIKEGKLDSKLRDQLVANLAKNNNPF